MDRQIETVRELDDQELELVAGGGNCGAPPPPPSCHPCGGGVGGIGIVVGLQLDLGLGIVL